MTITSLSRVLPPPPSPKETKGDWLAFEGAIGTQLPDDFKEFIETYGSGTIGNFISVLNPFSSRENLNLATQARRQLDALERLHKDFGERRPYELYPTKGGLLPVAITDNGDVVHWLTNGDPNDWVIVVNESRSPDYEQFDCDLTSLIEGVLSRTLRCRAFPSSVFAADMSFRSV